ncbi:MAG: hypothetical protein RSD44_08925 [Akkermansia sp.]
MKTYYETKEIIKKAFDSLKWSDDYVSHAFCVRDVAPDKWQNEPCQVDFVAIENICATDESFAQLINQLEKNGLELLDFSEEGFEINGEGYPQLRQNEIGILVKQNDLNIEEYIAWLIKSHDDIKNISAAVQEIAKISSVTGASAWMWKSGRRTPSKSAVALLKMYRSARK